MSCSTPEPDTNKRAHQGSPARSSISHNRKRARMDESDTIIAEVSPASETRDSTTTHHNAQTSLSEKESHGSQPVVKRFIEHGNVVLKFRAAADEQDVHLVVSADFMCAASPVWKILFTGRMKEAITLQVSGFVEVPMPTVELPALELILSVLHHQSQRITSPPSLDLIVQVMNACDKYNLSYSLKPFISGWLQGHSIPKLDVVEIGLYMLVAEGCCKDLSQPIRHHALETLTLDSWGQWRKHELFGDPVAEAITNKLFREIKSLAERIEVHAAGVEASLQVNFDAHNLTAEGCQHCYHPGENCETTRQHVPRFQNRVEYGPCNHHVRVSAFMDIARKAGVWGSVKKLSAAQVIKNFDESLAHGRVKCSAALNCPLQLGLKRMVRLVDLDLRETSVVTLGG